MDEKEVLLCLRCFNQTEYGTGFLDNYSLVTSIGNRPLVEDIMCWHVDLQPSRRRFHEEPYARICVRAKYHKTAWSPSSLPEGPSWFVSLEGRDGFVLRGCYPKFPSQTEPARGLLKTSRLGESAHGSRSIKSAPILDDYPALESSQAKCLLHHPSRSLLLPYPVSSTKKSRTTKSSRSRKADCKRRRAGLMKTRMRNT